CQVWDSSSDHGLF
nr:immunoglobulin light chain junction region [Macaca mulatta]MPN65226.1 immunoglobulin light chain junction region [Macaca mulatta]MPN65228.1 immunoglobulin light chain junction region [Macaca mulatta]MPN65236.1 immunoglobulin light chain junction region [Macaca mulatta]MPN65238.1 immunoglobulin light chain junction region [Macaca mulatta]